MERWRGGGRTGAPVGRPHVRASDARVLEDVANDEPPLTGRNRELLADDAEEASPQLLVDARHRPDEGRRRVQVGNCCAKGSRDANPRLMSWTVST